MQTECLEALLIPVADGMVLRLEDESRPRELSRMPSQ